MIYTVHLCAVFHPKALSVKDFKEFHRQPSGIAVFPTIADKVFKEVAAISVEHIPSDASINTFIDQQRIASYYRLPFIVYRYEIEEQDNHVLRVHRDIIVSCRTESSWDDGIQQLFHRHSNVVKQLLDKLRNKDHMAVMAKLGENFKIWGLQPRHYLEVPPETQEEASPVVINENDELTQAKKAFQIASDTVRKAKLRLMIIQLKSVLEEFNTYVGRLIDGGNVLLGNDSLTSTTEQLIDTDILAIERVTKLLEKTLKDVE